MGWHPIPHSWTPSTARSHSSLNRRRDTHTRPTRHPLQPQKRPPWARIPKRFPWHRPRRRRHAVEIMSPMRTRPWRMRTHTTGRNIPSGPVTTVERRPSTSRAKSPPRHANTRRWTSYPPPGPTTQAPESLRTHMVHLPPLRTILDSRRRGQIITRRLPRRISRLHVSFPPPLPSRAASRFHGWPVVIAAASRPPRLPPLQPTEMSPDQYYPQSAGAQLGTAFGQDAKSPRPASQHNTTQKPAPGRGPVPKFQRLKSTQELKPRINAQPPYRRANPEGGFISVSSPGYGHWRSLD